MGWVKRNILFLVGGLVCVLLLGGAGFYLFTRVQLNKELSEKITQAYAEAETTLGTTPGPGSGKVDNIVTAKEQVAQMREIIAKQVEYFRPIPPIPANAADTNGISDHDFASALRDTISEMQQEAASASVQLPPKYDFSFSVIKTKITFAPGSLAPLAAQLGEVKAITDIVFRSRVNSLDSIRRVRVSPDDKDSSEYLDTPQVTNDLAVIEPYEVVVRCFSGELASLLAGFANSPNGFLVKTVTVDPGSAGAPAEMAQPRSLNNEDPEPPRVNPQAAPVAPVAAPGGPRGGLPTVINEHPLRVTLMLQLVKLKTPAK